MRWKKPLGNCTYCKEYSPKHGWCLKHSRRAVYMRVSCGRENTRSSAHHGREPKPWCDACEGHNHVGDGSVMGLLQQRAYGRW